MRDYGVAVVGCGVMGAQHLSVVSQHGRCRVVEVVDHKADRAKEYASRFGASSSSTDVSRCLERKDVDIVIVATRPSSHDRIATEALRAGKHVFCEKPMAASLEAAGAIIKAARGTDRKTMIGFILRHSRLYQKAAEMMRGGAIGQPAIMRLHGGEHNLEEEVWQENLRLLKDTSPVIDCGSHYVDVMRWFSGAEVQTVCGVGSRTEPDVPAGAYNYQLISLTFGDGSVGSYDVGWGKNFRDFSEKEFVGPKGRLRLIYRGDRFEFHEEGDLLELYTYPDHYEFINVKEPLLDWNGQFQAFLDLIDRDGDPLPWLLDAYKSLEIVVAGQQAIAQRKTIAVQSKAPPGGAL